VKLTSLHMQGRKERRWEEDHKVNEVCAKRSGCDELAADECYSGRTGGAGCSSGGHAAPCRPFASRANSSVSEWRKCQRSVKDKWDGSASEQRVGRERTGEPREARVGRGERSPSLGSVPGRAGMLQ